MPGDQVFEPGQAVFFNGSAKTDGIVLIEVTIVVRSKRYFKTDHLSYLCNIFYHFIETFISELHLCKWVLSGAISSGRHTPLPANIPEIGVHYGARYFGHHFQSEVHFQESKSFIL